MLWVLLGLLAGAGVVALTNALSAPGTLLTDFVSAIAHTGGEAAHALVRATGFGTDTPLAAGVSAVVAVLTPGLVCLAVAEAVAATRSARNAASLLLTAGAFLSFLWLPGTQALTLLLAAVVLNVLLGAARGAFLLFPTTAAITTVTGHLLSVALRQGDLITENVSALATIGGDPTIWRLALSAVALAPALAALMMLVRRR